MHSTAKSQSSTTTLSERVGRLTEGWTHEVAGMPRCELSQGQTADVLATLPSIGPISAAVHPAYLPAQRDVGLNCVPYIYSLGYRS